ncbi:glycyl-tRNA synthetase subunit beta [Campylobacter mucosalis]|uniref:glycine--tRNA ligase subunit beta n=1 Tax=Campylobacter mucosalis TaxID=202 RepID=UPI0004D65DE2|nr:glycine--tRNA ligase subunit beta [Campylobacter mucosalis]KEA46610.1 glycyl-tRNA synthetase subunit beta [Campylobacter mucosalis]QKF62882.1 glycyl-tRNA synthetase, beta chain [Campylobacter mucosalis]
MKELLIEIGVEELPAIPFLKELPNIRAKWQAVLSEYRLESEFDFYFTPRRLVFFHKNFSELQSDTKAEFIGAPKHVALKDGVFTPAALSFAKKCEISQDELSFKEIDGKEVLYYEKSLKGENSKELLGDMIEKFLLSLNFGKSMRWGNGEFEFIRPIRSFLCLFDDKSVEFSKFGVKSEVSTYPHRSIGYEKVKISTILEYFKGAKDRGIILDPDERRAIILEQFKNLEKNGINIQIDDDLLSEVVAITEYPTALLGEFESEFLAVPSEVIIASMKENQRYFPVFKDGKLANKFVVVSNAITDDNSLIVKGNEKVLRARLSDAMFFWQSDLSSEFSPEKLKNITYLKELGSMYDKELRELKIAKFLSSLYKDRLSSEAGVNYESKIERAVMLSKADLTTGMVYEFTELQGIMGHYYARAKGEDEVVVNAIKEQYLPDGENSAIPSSVFSSVAALSAKLDALVGLFSVGKIPSGTKDPYALRRAANGVIKIVTALNLEFNLREILVEISKNYAKFDVSVLENFILDRIYTFFDANPSIIKSCINSDERDILSLFKAINALNEVTNKPSFKENFSTFKRLANIIKDSEISAVDESLFNNEFEKSLNDRFKSLSSNPNDFNARLTELFGLKPQIDEFFDNVMINADDVKIKANRIAIIGQIYKEFLKIADIKEISL